jgi:hypothetical protein
MGQGHKIDMNIFELNDHMVALRKVVGDKTKELFAIQMAETVSRRLDRKFIDGEECSLRNECSEYRTEFRNDYKEQKVTGYRDSRIDFEVKLLLYPYKRNFYLFPIVEREDLLNVIIESSDKITWFGWWDSTDCPENVSKKEWSARKRVWNGIFANTNGTYGGTGFEINLTLPYYEHHYVSPDELLSCFPSKEQRARTIAKDRVYFSVYVPDENFSSFGPVLDAMDYLKTPEGIAKIEAETLVIMDLIPDTYDSDEGQ